MAENPNPPNAPMINVPCNACGAKMSYNPEKQLLLCEHCGATRELPKAQDMVVEQDFSEGIDLNKYDTGFGVEQKVFHCGDCGSETAVAPETVAFECPFCGSKNVDPGAHAKRMIKPSGILPFKVPKKTALSQFKDWLKKGLFTPSDLKKVAKLEKINGVYIPYWTYDAMTYSQWRADAGYHYYETEYYTDSEGNQQSRQVQRTNWVPASGYYETFFDDVLVVGSHGVQQNMSDQVEPFQLHEVVNYDAQYILGMQSEVYQKDIMQGFQVAEQKMDSSIRSACAQQVPGDTHRNLQVHTRKDKITFKHMLLPLWIAAYKYKNKAFQFLVNGQTGKVAGKKPVSAIKVAIAVAIGIVVIGGIIYLISQNQG